jgi:hypothetical protein
MGKQSRNARVREHVGRGATEDDLTQARVTVGAHNQEDGGLVACGTRKQLAAGAP